MGGKAITGHPSCFWFAAPLKLFLIVYVDDLLLSGPADKHAAFWDELGSKVNIEPAEDLDRYLGRHHIISPCDRLPFNLIEHFVSPVAV